MNDVNDPPNGDSMPADKIYYEPTITTDLIAKYIHVHVQTDGDCIDSISLVNTLCFDANEKVEGDEMEHEFQREEEKERVKNFENNLSFEFDLAQFPKINTGCICDSNSCAICVEINSCINSLSLECANFPQDGL